MDKVFVPFMLGTISLIVFFNARNQHLGTRIREICDKLINSASFSSPGVTTQLSALMNRYQHGVTALVIAILAVMSFGSMLLSYLILNPELYGNVTRDPATGIAIVSPLSGIELWQRALIFIFALLGGLFATIASAYSRYEIMRARKSLWTYTAMCLLNCDLPKTPAHIDDLRDNLAEIQRMLQGQISTSLYNEFDGLLDEIRRLSRGARNEQPSEKLVSPVNGSDGNQHHGSQPTLGSLAPRKAAERATDGCVANEDALNGELSSAAPSAG